MSPQYIGEEVHLVVERGEHSTGQVRHEVVLARFEEEDNVCGL